MNLGGYSRENFNESTGNRILENFLHSNSLIFTHFSQQDKTPNFDGYFEILKQATGKNIPIGRYEVQIKTMDHNYINTNKQKNCSQYKYSCETKIFNAVKNAITLNPCYLFMVDVNKKRIFAKYISLEFVLSLNLKDEKNKTIYFNDTDEIKNVNYFYEVTKKVYLKKSKELNNIEKNELIVTNNLTCSEMSELQRELDYLNNVFDTELSFVKSKLFPQIWKFGLAYLKDKNSVGIGIYYICKGKNGQYFKRLD